MERHDFKNEHQQGKGFYNEFGMDTALGFEEAAIGGWFHKIGVGLLKKKTLHTAVVKILRLNPLNLKLMLNPILC
jgi:hypothetical protein